MRKTLGIGIFLSLLMAGSASACLRPAVDERAVQWSTAIVFAKLTKIDPPKQLAGGVLERRGPLGALGNAETVYLARVYHFTVEQTLDGTAKVGESIAVLRVTTKTTEPLQQCGQHLVDSKVNESFLLLLRPLSTFTQALPQGITPPNDPALQCVVHLEPRASVTADAMTALQNTIAGTRAAEDQFSQTAADKLLTRIATTIDATRSAPTIRAFEKFGAKGLTALEAAMKKYPMSSPEYSRLAGVKNEMSAPTMLLTMIVPEPGEPTDGRMRHQ